MSSILVVERDPRYLEPIREALASGGWRARLVSTVDQAIQSAASEAPDVVLVSLEVPGADAIASSFSRSAGGPGVIGLLPESMGEAQAIAIEADELIQKPFGPADLIGAVRRVAALRRQSPAPAAPSVPAQEAQRLTSHDIFGDVLAEVEDQAPSPQRPPVAPHRPASYEEVQRKLEKTLSGVGIDTRPKPPVAPQPPLRRSDPTSDDIDALLSKTLSNLDLGRTKTGVRPAAPGAAPAAPANATVRMEIPDFARTPAAPKAPAPPPLTPTPGGIPIVSRPVAKPAPTSPSMFGDLDLTDIENLARTSRSPARPPAPPAPVAPVAPAAAVPPGPPAPAAPPPIQPTGASVAPSAPASDPHAATQRIPVWTGAEAGDSPGSAFGQYTLLEKIAVGGMAEVWKARSRGVEGFQKTVAIKKILPHMTDNVDFVGMFIDEAKLAAQLNHPNIVHIYDLGKIGRDYYIAMEYVDGKDLRSLLNSALDRQLRMPPGLAALIAARLASALDYAHRKRDFDAKEMGLVHRDVSPQNVLLTHEGDVKLCDFGIAKAVAKAGQTQTGALKGKLQYMSPEQAWGRAVDGRSDLFSLGSVLFEMLTAQRLFPGDTEISILDSVRQGKIRAPRQVDPSVPLELDEIVRKALAVDPAERFQSAGEMLQHLEGYLSRVSPSVGPTDVAGFLERAFRPAPPPPAYEIPDLPEPAAYVSLYEEKPALAEAPPIPSPWSSPPDGPDANEPMVPPAPLSSLAPPPQNGAEEANVAAVVPLTEVAPALREGEKKGKLLLWVAIAALLLIGALLYFYLSSRGAKAGAAPAAVETSSAPAPAATSDLTALPLTSEGAVAPAPGVNIEGMVNQALAKREQELRQQQEESLKKLQQQVNASKPAPPGTAPEPARAAPVEAVPAPAPAPQAEPPVERVEPKPEPPPQRQADPEPVREPEAPRVRPGDLVSAGPGVVGPQLVSAPNPEYPAMARNLKVQGMVVISVLVNENGQVEDARIAEPIRQNVGLNESALRAARGARYRSATKDGVRVKMWTRIRIPFKL